MNKSSCGSDRKVAFNCETRGKRGGKVSLYKKFFISGNEFEILTLWDFLILNL